MSFEQGRVFSDTGEIPRILQFDLSECPGHGLQRADNALHIAPAAKFRHEPSPWLERPLDAADDPLGLRDPVQDGIGQHGVKRLVKREVPGIGNLQ